jgi:hypothetical protein
MMVELFAAMGHHDRPPETRKVVTIGTDGYYVCNQAQASVFGSVAEKMSVD